MPAELTYEELLDVGLRGTRDAANRIHIYGCVTPSEYSKTFLPRNLFQQALTSQTLLLLNRQKAHRHAIFARRGKRKPEIRGFFREERMGDLNKYPRAVARLGIATACTAVCQIDKNLQSFQHDVVRATTCDVRDKANSARIVFILGIVKPLGRWRMALEFAMYTPGPPQNEGRNSPQYNGVPNIRQIEFAVLYN